MNDNMRKTILLMIAMLAIVTATASTPVSIFISDGISDVQMKAKMEQAMSALFTEAGAAYEANPEIITGDMPTPVKYYSEEIRDAYKKVESVAEFTLLNKLPSDLRKVYEEIFRGSDDEDDKYHEAVLNFDKRGNMTSFHLAISNNLYMNVIKSNLQLTDLRRRQLILDWTEQFRTAYNQKDLNFLEAVFSDDALILTGKVMERKTRDGVALPPEIVIIEKNKREYLKSLKSVFQSNKNIRVTFDEIEVLMHSTSKDVYGVTLRQGWTSDRYHDDGYLFLLWDFKDEFHPQIHVRAWQPEAFDKTGNPVKRVEISPDDFDI